MGKEKSSHSAAENKSADRAPYESPAIIYEGLITTRAGTPESAPAKDAAADTGSDAADIFK